MEKYVLDIDTTRRKDNIMIDLPLGEYFSSNISQVSLLNDYVDKIKENNVNNIVNYEKYLFYPIKLQSINNNDKISLNFNTDKQTYFNNDNLLSLVNGNNTLTTNLDPYSHNVDKIKFNIHLREREKDSNGNYSTWDAKESAFWNIWDGTFEYDVKKITKANEKNILPYGDLLGDLGFTDEDVKYQKNALKKSFLRISIYDTPYRQNQKLLYYSTLFFDTNELYKKYSNLSLIKNDDIVNFNGFSDDEQLLVSGSNLLTSTFTCTSKNNTDACSDGFYLYLFNSLIKENKPCQLFMKIEFNNAKYGKTVPLVLPRYVYEYDEEKHNVKHYENDVINFTSNDFPLDYETDGELTNGNTYIDIKKLNRDLYTPIFVRYNTITKHFEWSVLQQIDNNKHDSTLELTLYEPIINRLKSTEPPIVVLWRLDDELPAECS